MSAHGRWRWGIDASRVSDVAARFAALEVADPAEAARLRAVCARKTKIPSKVAARDAAKRLKRQEGSGYAYECRVCGFWHVSKMAPDAHRDMESARAGGGR